MKRCPQCAAELETPVGCAACGALLSVSAATSPFEIFGMPVSFDVDPAELRRRLLRFSRLVHPDFHARGTAETKRMAEHDSAALNSSHEILADDVQRADWLIAHLGGPSEKDVREMPKAFLMEVLEWNELLENARGAPPSAEMDAELRELEATLRSNRSLAIQTLGRLLSPIPGRASPRLAEARHELNAIRYIDRALEEIEALRLSRASR